MPEALQITTPDSGILLDDMLFADGAVVPKGRFIQPRIQAEIACVMGADLAGAGVGRAELIATSAAVCPSLEILDMRILRVDPGSGEARTIVDTVSENATNGGVVLGSARHRPGMDLRWAGVILKRHGVVGETGLRAGVLDDPVLGIVWLVQRLARYGQGLSKGDIVLSGSFIRPVEAPPGSRFTADFGGFGHVSIYFA